MDTIAAPARPDPKTIKEMFSSIAPGYDLANTVLSGGIHILWRKELVNWSELPKGHRVLDCATGTGDLAFEFKKKTGNQGHVIGTDFCEEMIERAQKKALKKSVPIVFETADATNLPYPDNSFDLCSIAFGIRNVADPLKGLTEMARVVRPGGTVMVLEFGQPIAPIFNKFYQFYSKYLLPSIGGLLTGKKSAYQYLQKSSAKFPCGENFKNFMKSTQAFSTCEMRPLSGGIAYMYRATVK